MTVTASKFQVGQEVILTSNYRPDRTVTITRVGRKYVYVSGPHGREYSYDRQSGNGVGNGYGRIWTIQEWQNHNECLAAHTALRAAGLETRSGFYGKFTTDQLRRIVAIANETEEDRQKAMMKRVVSAAIDGTL